MGGRRMRIVNKYGETVAELKTDDEGYGYFTEEELKSFGDILFEDGDIYTVRKD